VVLEKAVIFERDAANPPKYGAFHEVVSVGAELQKQMSAPHRIIKRHIPHQ
jgi:hypothetical protein